MTVLSHPTTGEALPPVLTTTEAAELLGTHRDTVIDQCRLGLLPTMPRIGSAPHKIITAQLLRQLGLNDNPPENGGGKASELKEIRVAAAALLSQIDRLIEADVDAPGGL